MNIVKPVSVIEDMDVKVTAKQKFLSFLEWARTE